MATKLQHMRQRAGMTQAEAAEACGVSLGVWRHYEQGSRLFDGANIKTIVTTAIKLNCNIEDLVEDEETAEEIIRYYSKRGIF